ncbi:MAG TPA: acyl dehydratase [Burkholderiaceae bacterium]|nr:acyl dehydratase [Burkholderiaceae bacterium]
MGYGLYYEDQPVGGTYKSMRRTIQDADLCTFVNVAHFIEPLFTDMEFMRNESDIKGRLVPGSMVYVFAEGLLCHSTMQGTGYAFLGMELNVEKPTFVGDTIHVECEITEARLSASRPGRGIVRSRNRVVRQNGDVVLTYTPLRMIKCRSAEVRP